MIYGIDAGRPDFHEQTAGRECRGERKYNSGQSNPAMKARCIGPPTPGFARKLATARQSEPDAAVESCTSAGFNRALIIISKPTTEIPQFRL